MTDPTLPLQWTCHACRRIRPDAQISVITHDVSDENHLPPKTMMINVRYCNDRPECLKKAKEIRKL